jgi:hypothetical protein
MPPVRPVLRVPLLTTVFLLTTVPLVPTAPPHREEVP